MASRKPIGTIAECYAHAVAVGREAAARYREFAELMAERGEEATADLFQRLAGFDTENADALARRAARIALPPISPLEHSWLDDAPPESVSHELLQLLSAHDAILIALDNARRARTFFGDLVSGASDAEARSLASQLTAGETERIRCLEDALAGTPRPLRVGEELIGLMH